MELIEELRENIEGLFEDTSKDATAKAYKVAALLALDAYEQQGRMAALSECRALIVKMAALASHQNDEFDLLEEVLKR